MTKWPVQKQTIRNSNLGLIDMKLFRCFNMHMRHCEKGRIVGKPSNNLSILQRYINEDVCFFPHIRQTLRKKKKKKCTKTGIRGTSQKKGLLYVQSVRKLIQTYWNKDITNVVR